MNEIPKVSELLRQHGLRPRKGLGQNFLADPVHLERIVAAAELTKEDSVLEIGPGLGTLTVRLAAQAGRVVAVELDRQLLPILGHVLTGLDNVSIVQGDILEMDPAEVTATGVAAGEHLPHQEPWAPLPYKVVANLPYYITSAIIRHLLTAAQPPTLSVLTVQREVALRIVAEPPKMSLLTVSVLYYAQPELVARVPAGAFYPVPQVDSAILRLRTWPSPPVDTPGAACFFQVVRAGFGQRRKQLRNALRAGLSLPVDQVEAMLKAADIAPERRAETLTLQDWSALAWAWHESRPPSAVRSEPVGS